MIIISAHIGHWYSGLAFIVPAVLAIAWIRWQDRRGRSGRMEFDELWTLHLLDGEWVLTATTPTPPRARRRADAKFTQVPAPWSQRAGEVPARATGDTFPSPSAGAKPNGSDTTMGKGR